MPTAYLPRTLRILLPAVFLILAGVHADPAQAQWRWRDATGRVTVSDLPPPREIADKDILSRPATSAARTAGTSPAPVATSTPAAAASVPGVPDKPLADAQLEARKKAAEQEQAAKTRAEESRVAAQRTESCRRARSHIAALDSGQRLARVNDKGEREFMDDRARADEMRQAREVVASECRPTP